MLVLQPVFAIAEEQLCGRHKEEPLGRADLECFLHKYAHIKVPLYRLDLGGRESESEREREPEGQREGERDQRQREKER